MNPFMVSERLQHHHSPTLSIRYRLWHWVTRFQFIQIFPQHKKICWELRIFLFCSWHRLIRCFIRIYEWLKKCSGFSTYRMRAHSIFNVCEFLQLNLYLFIFFDIGETFADATMILTSRCRARVASNVCCWFYNIRTFTRTKTAWSEMCEKNIYFHF